MTREEWVAKCQHWKAKWPVMQPEYLDDTNGLNIYAVLDAISIHAPDDAVIMADAGSAFYMVPQAFRFKKGQRLVMSQSQGDMGWAVPASIGVAKASDKPVICIVGDGSFMSNLQELAVIKEHDLNIKIVILNNNGYLSIKNTQSKFFEGRVHGVNEQTGVWFPDFFSAASTFEMPHYEIADNNELKDFLTLLDIYQPMIIECRCTPDQQILPSQGFKDGKQAPLHDMVPFLSDEEMKQELLI